MSPLGKIIYSADKIDPLRGYDSSPLIKSCMRDYAKGFVEVLKANKEQISALIGIPRPSLSRELMKLRDEGIIDFNQGKYPG